MRQTVARAAGLAIACAAALAAAPLCAGPRVIASEAFFPEGPWRDGDRLLWVEYAGGTLKAWDGGKAEILWRLDGCGPSAVAPFEGGWIVTCYDAGSLALLDAAFETRAILEADASGSAILGPNDLAPDGAGGVWITASGPWEPAPIVGRVLHLAPGAAAPREAAAALHYANGIAVGPHDGRLYVAESEAGRVISFAVGADGSLSDRRLFVRLAGIDPGSGPGAYPDGIEWGPDGRLWIGQYSSGRVLAVEPDGTLARLLEVPAAAAPNLVHSADGATLFVTAVDQTDDAPYRGRVLALPLD